MSSYSAWRAKLHGAIAGKWSSLSNSSFGKTDHKQVKGRHNEHSACMEKILCSKQCLKTAAFTFGILHIFLLITHFYHHQV